MRRLFVISCLVIVGLLVWAGIYARKQGFTNSWRAAIESELATHGYHVEIGKLTLGAFRGLVAEDVKFFTSADRSEMFAEVNDIYLDVELDRVLQKEISINTLDIQNGRLTIPLSADAPVADDPIAANVNADDPNADDPDVGKKLFIKNLSGRVSLTESRIEIVRVEANLAGVDVFLKGSLLRPPNQSSKINKAGKEAIDATVSKIQSLKKVIDVLDNFVVPKGETKPSLKIDFRGDLRDLSTTTATAELVAGRFRKKGSGYVITSLTALAEYDGRVKQIKIPRFELLDQSGAINAEGLWKQDGNELQFDVTSSADVIRFLEALVPNKKWGEVVFFHPPNLRVEGVVNLDQINEPEDGLFFPGHILGEFSTDRFVTSGVIFNGSRGDFSILGKRFYVRNFQADHKTGAAFLNCKFEPGKGRNSLQFQSVVKLDPRIFGPFLKDDEARRFLSKWHFSDSSGVDLAAAGQGSDISLNDLQAEGKIYLRDFRLNRIPFDELKADFEIDGPIRWYRNVNLTRKEGTIAAELAYTDTNTKHWEIKGGISTVNLDDGIGALSPPLKKLLEPYQFSSPPTIKIDGLIDARSGAHLVGEKRQTELDISFTSKGEAQYQFLGGNLKLGAPGGTIRLVEDRVHVENLKAGLAQGTLELEFDAPEFWKGSGGYDASVSLRNLDLQTLGGYYEFANEAKEKCSGTMHFSGKISQVDSLNGHGSISVANEDLFQIPILQKLEPHFEISVGSGKKSSGRATASFAVTNGVFSSKNMAFAPRKLALQGLASIDFPARTVLVDLKRKGSAKGNRYLCEGTFSDPKWKVEAPPAPATLSEQRPVPKIYLREPN